MVEEQLVFAFHKDRMFAFERAQLQTDSCFGGPLEVDLSGVEHGPRPLHLIARLGGSHILGLGFGLPLIYGMSYSGCDLRYRIDGVGKIEILKLQPTESSEDWPYRNFPPLLPYVPLRLSDAPALVDYSEFAQRFPNMPEQQPAELVVAVPPPATVGLSLWGAGDGEGVTIVFEYDLEDRIVSSYNVT